MSKEKLESMTKSELVDQGAIRGFTNFQGKTKEQIIQLCVNHRKRKRYQDTVPEGIANYDTDEITELFSQRTEADDSDDQ